MDIIIATVVGISVFILVMAVDAWLVGHKRKGPGHWFQQHWFWQTVREAKWIFRDKPAEQVVAVKPGNEGESARG